MIDLDKITPFDRASFYVEQLKYVGGKEDVEIVTGEQIEAQLEALLRDANISSMSGKELLSALTPYGYTYVKVFEISRLASDSIFLDGVMHGIALAGGLDGPMPDDRHIALNK